MNKISVNYWLKFCCIIFGIQLTPKQLKNSTKCMLIISFLLFNHKRIQVKLKILTKKSLTERILKCSINRKSLSRLQGTSLSRNSIKSTTSKSSKDNLPLFTLKETFFKDSGLLDSYLHFLTDKDILET
jgi:hypothetical protein